MTQITDQDSGPNADPRRYGRTGRREFVSDDDHADKPGRGRGARRR
jgi:hypothetical protein